MSDLIYQVFENETLKAIKDADKKSFNLTYNPIAMNENIKLFERSPSHVALDSFVEKYSDDHKLLKKRE